MARIRSLADWWRPALGAGTLAVRAGAPAHRLDSPAPEPGRPMLLGRGRAVRTGAGLVALLAVTLAHPAWAQQPAAPPPAKAPGAAPRRPPPPTWGFGEKVTVRGCLRFLVDNYRDRQSDVDNHDWVRLRVENVCRRPIRNLLVELLLVDAQGVAYGTPVWVVAKGEQLIPGGFKEDDWAIPDPDSRVARRWSLRVLRAEGLPKAAPPAAKK